MLHSLKCKIINATDNYVVVNVGPFNLELIVPKADNFIIGSEIELFSYIHWNQEQGPSLFGFATMAEKQTFLLLISCSGIGPKMAIAVLSQLSPSEFINAVQMQDIKILSSVSGIGAKKAEHIAVQLKHKVEKIVDVVMSEPGIDLQGIKQLRQVLQSLNYSGQEVNSAVEYARTNSNNNNFDFLLRKALSFLSKSV